MGKIMFVPFVAAFAAAVAGCGDMNWDMDEQSESPDAQYAGICVDRNDMRVNDDRCGDYDDEGFLSSNDGMHYVWMPMSYNGGNYGVPGVGSYAYQFVGKDKALTKVPKGTPVAKGVPATGGKSMSAIQRGGFGIKSGTTGGSGAKAGAMGKSGGS
jgi:hypothetical protein